MKILFCILLPLLMFFGCSKPETQLYEQGGNTYFVDKNGEIYIIQGTSKIKVEDYIEPYVPPFKEKLSFTEKVTHDNLNLSFDCKFRFMDKIHYEINIRPIDGENFENTTDYDRIDRDTGNLFIINFKTDDGFEIYQVKLNRDDYRRVSTSGGVITGIKFVGTFSMSKENYNLIDNILISSSVND